jgi:multicomponent Na+:H+ antiporter subunit G
VTVVEVIGAVFMAGGATLSFLATWGIVDFDTPLARMHAATKCASLGLALLSLGGGIAAGSGALTGFAVLIMIFLFMTAPISSHMLGRAAYAAGQVTTLLHDDLRGRELQPLRITRSTVAQFSVLRVALSAVVWVILWRDPSIGVWVGGIAIALGLEFLRKGIAPRNRYSLPGVARFLIGYVGRVFVSNLRVAWEVITPNNDSIREAIVAVPLETRSRSVALLVANAITFTPGTMTLGLTQEPFELYIHVLHFESVAQVRADVADLEALASRAVMSPVTATS